MALTRRALLGAGALSLLPVAAPAVLGRARARVVVVGGGAGGASVARALAADGAGALAVTVVEPRPAYTACFRSNLYLGGLVPFDSLVHAYDGLARAGVAVVPQAAGAIDRDRREVVLADGGRLAYDRLVLSPGIALDYDCVPGWSQAAEEIMPHAWTGGAQTRLLRRKFDAVPDGGVIVIIAPPNPYRCPPAPYERASLMAQRLKATGRGRAKIFIIDPKDKFSKQGLFQEGWEARYPGMIEWMAPDIADGLKSVDPKTGTVVTGFETYAHADLVNVIPAQSAGAIARAAGLADRSGWCPIDGGSMVSRMDPNVFILGDAAIAGDMPKSAFAANSQAHVAARAVRAGLTDRPAPEARYANICWSLIAADDAVKVGGVYVPANGRITEVERFISQTGEAADVRRAGVVEGERWSTGLAAEIFG
ncbi:NAD(P)/FAD-dependent oxidoreductase [Xanthobacter agilis]|uniref:NADPH-dependent 2,4-dienoyl-CoA reductase/sulfur reductase-like enzyme n=1 Tax=Xanthobacter agilis TaxID=47492 RepID=A0ABU0LEJ4_XANAG|nr:NAD(P)/FAD-dependent oxidoreductase [Xanthobacter agilis]MDQ0505564.1 NADPH-dependent 2,4-dienoyl-CoA reductase/sulfur reductase-like enzyme [Xanthobacter agilis]